MNIHRQKEAELLENALKALGLSGKNMELALQYMDAGQPADDSILAQAEWQNLSQMTNDLREKSISYAEMTRRNTDKEPLQRYKKLLWAIGGSTAGACLYDNPSGSQNARNELLGEEAEDQVLFGREGALALFVERMTCEVKSSFHQDLIEHLYHLGKKDPELLLRARTCEKSESANARSLLTAVYLMNRKPGKPGDSAENAQSDRLLQAAEHSVSALLEGAGDATGQKALADYFHRAEAGTPLTQEAIAVMRQANPAAGNLLNTNYQFRGYVAWQMGFDSFLAQRYDPRQRAVVRVSLYLVPVSFIQSIFRIVPPEYRASQMEALCEDLPGGAPALIHWMCRQLNYLQPDTCPEFLWLAKHHPEAWDKAMENAGPNDYPKIILTLKKVLPSAATGKKAEILQKMQANILGVVDGMLAAGQNAAHDYLAGRSAADQMQALTRQLQPAQNCWVGDAFANQLKAYEAEAGKDTLYMRTLILMDVLDRPYIIRRTWCKNYEPEPQEIVSLARALQKHGLSLADSVRVTSDVVESIYGEEERKKTRVAMADYLADDAYLAELPALAKGGNVFVRCSALTALCSLSAKHPECRQTVLDCAGDSSKAVREELVLQIAARPDWQANAVKLLNRRKAAEREVAVAVLRQWNTPEARIALETALAAEKNEKLANTMRAALGQEPLDAAGAPAAGAPLTPEEQAAAVLKGGKKRKVQWLLETPLHPLHQKQQPDALAAEDVPAALLVAYCDQGTIGISKTAEVLAADISESDLSAFAAEVYDKWFEAGAQSKHKWVLAFAAVFGGAEMTPRLSHAIRDWPQHARGAIACDAVTALAISPDPAALLEVDSISRKFKFRQVKAAAGKALELAAQARGITAEELADRIVPQLGFDEAGNRVFDYGTRSFTVTLTPTLELLLKNDQGKQIKSMPAPGKTDDAEKSALAYDAFKQMKKQIRTTVSAQKLRLENALSGLRTWDSEAWTALFVHNPIMHQFAISLIWGVYENGTLKDTFRYMEDGSFNTVDEEEYTLPAGAKIGLAHPVEMEEQALKGWRGQLKDYEITQSILQLERPVARTTEQEKGKKELERFGGKKLNGLSLSGKLIGQGWYRGSVQDAGCYSTFYQENPASGLEVELRFSGSYIGDENDTVTVYDAVFYPMGHVKHGSYEYDTPKENEILALDKVPMRYFSEVVYQLEKATASSTETDENWRKKR